MRRPPRACSTRRRSAPSRYPAGPPRLGLPARGRKAAERSRAGDQGHVGHPSRDGGSPPVEADIFIVDGGPADRPRHVVPAPRGRRRPHARRLGDAVRRRPASARRVHRRDREPSPPRPALPPEARLRPVRPGPAALGGRPAPEPRATTCARPRCPRRAPRSSCAPSPGACSRSSSTATSRCGRSGSSRVSRATASRSSPRRTTRSSTASRASTSSRVLFDLAPERESRPSPSTAGSPPRCLAHAAAGGGAARARHRPQRDRAVRARGVPRAAADRRGRARLARRRRRDGVGRHEPGAAEPLQLPASARTAASPGSARTSTTSRRSRTGSAAR